MQVGGAFVPLSFLAEAKVGAGGGHEGEARPMGAGQQLLSKPSRPFYRVPLTRYTALLLFHFHKESIEEIKNMSSGEFKIRFLQNTTWKREEENRSREPMTCTRPTLVAGSRALWLPEGKAPGVPAAGARGEQRAAPHPGLLQRPLPSLLVPPLPFLW